MKLNNFNNPLDEKEYSERQIQIDEDIRGPYFRDQTSLIYSLPFRRLKNKAQVFFSPNNDHVCTRIEHAFHVATVGATIARELGLNDEMVYAIALGHDIGHAPFGHAGETVLHQKCKDIGGFIHEIHGLRVVDKLGNRCESLNLAYGVRDGIVCHCGEAPDQVLQPRKKKVDLSTIKSRKIYPCSYEGCVARMSDRIAYLGRDLEDALLGGFIRKKDIPSVIKKHLGETTEEITNTFVIDVLKTSTAQGTIALSNKSFELLMKLYKFSMENIYNHDAIKRYQLHCERIIEQLFEYLCNIFDKWGWKFNEYRKSPVPLDNRFGRYLKYMKRLYNREKVGTKVIVRDYVAGMTDGYALKCMKEISLPEELSFDINHK